jgi:hypothetical protein
MCDVLATPGKDGVVALHHLWGVDGILEDLLLSYASVLYVISSVESHVRTFVEEANHHIGNIFSLVLSAVLTSPSSSSVVEPVVQEEMDDESETVEIFSPVKVTPTLSANSKDEWGHFADFQEALADESTFLPSFAPKAKVYPLGTLDESEEEDEDEGDFF